MILNQKLKKKVHYSLIMKFCFVLFWIMRWKYTTRYRFFSELLLFHGHFLHGELCRSFLMCMLCWSDSLTWWSMYIWMWGLNSLLCNNLARFKWFICQCSFLQVRDLTISYDFFYLLPSLNRGKCDFIRLVQVMLEQARDLHRLQC